jgi:hypothetical protein
MTITAVATAVITSHVGSETSLRPNKAASNNTGNNQEAKLVGIRKLVID